MAEIEATIGNFVRTREVADPELPPADGPRALLKAQMNQLAVVPENTAWAPFRTIGARFAILAALVLAVAVGVLLEGKFQHGGRNHAASVVSLPNPALTPGSARPVALADLCSISHDDAVRTVPFGLQKQVFQEYGLKEVRAADYEVDYLITPGLGGSDDVKNLWPQPHSDTAWNSYVKDQLENHLHDLVCGGQVDLTTAQRDIASDWVAAYKKYFHTDKPLPVRVQSS